MEVQGQVSFVEALRGAVQVAIFCGAQPAAVADRLTALNALARAGRLTKVEMISGIVSGAAGDGSGTRI